MSTYEKPGYTITLTAPVGGAETDQGYIIGSIFAIATGGGVLPGSSTVAAGQPFEGLVCGQVMRAKKTGETWAEGDVIYWDDTTKESSNVAGDMAIGVAVSAVLAAVTTASVRLNGIANPASVAAGGRFVSTEQTGTGAPQNIAHGLGVVPSNWVVIMTAGHDGAGGPGTQMGESTKVSSDATNVVATVTNGVTYEVVAWR